MCENEVLRLCLVALGTGFILAIEVGAAAFEGAALVRVMAGGAAHLAAQHRVAVWHRKLCLLIKVALEAGFRGFLRIDDRSRTAASGNVLAAWAVARLTTNVLGIRTLGLQLRVIGGLEITHRFLVALGAGVGADKGGTRDPWRRDNRLGSGSTGDHDQSGSRGCSGQPECLPFKDVEESFHGRWILMNMVFLQVTCMRLAHGQSMINNDHLVKIILFKTR